MCSDLYNLCHSNLFEQHFDDGDAFHVFSKKFSATNRDKRTQTETHAATFSHHQRLNSTVSLLSREDSNIFYFYSNLCCPFFILPILHLCSRFKHFFLSSSLLLWCFCFFSILFFSLIHPLIFCILIGGRLFFFCTKNRGIRSVDVR